MTLQNNKDCCHTWFTLPCYSKWILSCLDILGSLQCLSNSSMWHCNHSWLYILLIKLSIIENENFHSCQLLYTNIIQSRSVVAGFTIVVIVWGEREREHHTEKDGISTHLNSADVIAKIQEFVIMKKMIIVTYYMKVKLHVASVTDCMLTTLNNIIQ